MHTGTPENFAAFMARALHDPEHGYYARNIRSIGQRGDFTTAPQLSVTPAKAIAAWISSKLRSTRTRDVIEIGPGLGTLTHQVILNLPLPLRMLTRFHFVESSHILAEHQKSLLGKKVRHHTSVHSALAACGGNAVIFSNELVDAFPVRLFEKAHGHWHEIALDHSVSPPRELLLPPAQLPPSSIFDNDYLDGQRVEVHDSYRIWLKSWLPEWKKGDMLTIDYGNTSEKIHLRRPKGSLRAYFLHQRSDGAEVYLNPGLRDITADVNFTDLSIWSDPWLESQPLINFADFIRPFASPTDTGMLEAASHFMTISQRPRSSSI